VAVGIMKELLLWPLRLLGAVLLMLVYMVPIGLLVYGLLRNLFGVG